MATSSPLSDIMAEYRTETGSEKFVRKTKESPFMVAGLGGAILGVIYGGLRFRNRGQISPSLYLIHLRVAAQGAVVSAVTIGVAYTLLKDYVFNRKEKKLET